MKMDVAVAIDPMALILRSDFYRIWVEIHNPHEPKVADFQEIVQKMSPDEQRAVLSRARALAEYGKAVEKAITEQRIADKPSK